MPKDKVYLRNLLLQRSSWMEERVLESARAHGYAQVTPAMSRLFGSMGGQPVGVSELARRMGVSRQAVHRLAQDAANFGLVEFVESPHDARVVRLQFTQAGWAMSAQAARDFEALESALKRQIGPRNVARLKELLAMPWDAVEDERRQEHSVNKS